jgi:energy-coupling factor transport system ATP-binding protein
MEKIFILQNVVLCYRQAGREVLALHDIDLAIDEGECVALMGANGSGKTTLAHLLNALLLPTRGRVISCGMDTRDASHLWEIRRQVGIILQNPENQIVGPTVEEDIAFGLENIGLERETMRSRVREVMEWLGIEELSGREPHLLSQGQKQKLALAGVLAMRPRAIISDEGTSLLDPRARGEALERLFQLNRQEGITLLNITHRLEEALQADRILVLERGRIIFDGTPRRLLGERALLETMGWEVPPLTRLAELLRVGGIPLPELVSDCREVVRALCP